jgi:uncharacterized protein with von Willebrand factor type A (vWA) domain
MTPTPSAGRTTTPPEGFPPATRSAAPDGGGQIARNVVVFARLLRASGLPVGLDRSTAALRAVEAVGLSRREDVHAALSATLVSDHAQQPLFDAAFDAFWRDPKMMERMLAALLPKVSGRGKPPAASQRPARLQQALAPPRAPAPVAQPESGDEAPIEALLTWSDRDRLRERDFESMTIDEFRAACRLVREVPLPVDPVPVRRWRAARRGSPDLRGTLRALARDPTLSGIRRRERRERPAPLVILCDVSGSMERYARILLHWAHALMRTRPRVAVFTFGTRLTDVTRALRHRDPDEAMEAASRAVVDWSGGTRIGPCLADFNRHWARRVLTGNAAVLLVTDGLDRADDGSLGAAAAQLARFARRVVWLNPLLRWDGFEPRAAGVRALLPHVDRHLPVHSLAKLGDLGRALRDASAPARYPIRTTN